MDSIPAANGHTRPPARAFVARPAWQAVPVECEDNTDCPCLPPDECVVYKHAEAFVDRCFTSCWAAALNARSGGRLTAFAMIHHDVSPVPVKGWLTRLLDEQHRTGADLLSVVLPIKTGHGLTSTAVFDPHTGRYKRLTLREVWSIPAVTFDAEAAGYPGCQLLTSTGLWVADFTRPWAEEVHFATRCELGRGPDGTFRADFFPEDWWFARMLHARGLRVMATKVLPCLHWGMQGFPNSQPWGTLAAEDWREDGGRWLRPPSVGEINAAAVKAEDAFRRQQAETRERILAGCRRTDGKIV